MERQISVETPSRFRSFALKSGLSWTTTTTSHDSTRGDFPHLRLCRFVLNQIDLFKQEVLWDQFRYSA